jgi:hypothetical protein
MPSLNFEFLRTLQDNYTDYPCFIETGTLEAGTTLSMEPHFETLYTIEYSEKYYNAAKNRYTGNKINFLHGDSGIVLETLLPTLNQKCIFFLDGHNSGGETGKSAKDCPLVEEITHIHNECKEAAIIIIDDYRLFGLNHDQDWSDIRKADLLDILGARVDKVYHLDSEAARDDRLVIHIHKKG